VDGSLLSSLKADVIPLGISGAIWETIHTAVEIDRRSRLNVLAAVER
jgi:hypothetical protein